MKGLHRIGAIAGACVLLLVTGAGAQTPAGTERRATEAGMVDANWLIDAPVRGHDGQELGTIARIWMDPATGQVRNVVVKSGGVDGRPVERRAIAWDDVRVAWTAQELIITMDPGAFGRALTADDADLRDAPAGSPATPSRR